MKTINRVREIWEEHGMMYLVIASIIFLCIYALLRIGEKGTYNPNTETPLWTRNYGLYNKEFPIHHQHQHPKKDSTGEQICRRYLEQTFNKPFNKDRPDFLKNPVMGGYNLELDCFNREMRLAVEYNGAQHYKYIPYFHKNKESFANQKYRDEMKRTKCREHGIHLIEVPYTVSHSEIPKFINRELVNLGFLQ